MITLTIDAFDDLIAGTGVTWYTPAEFNSLIGKGDYLHIHAATTAVSGTAPTLTCEFEHSANAEDWLPVVGTPEINGVAIANDSALTGSLDNIDFTPMLGLARIRITLGGTAPACRLKLYVAVGEQIVSPAAIQSAARIGWPSFQALVQSKGSPTFPGGDCGCKGEEKLGGGH